MAVCYLCRPSHVIFVAILLCTLRLDSADGAVNIATSAMCTASCQPDGASCTECQLAINGMRYEGDWRYVGVTVGAWLMIVFDKTYEVSSLVIVLPYYQDNRHFKDIKLTFTDGSDQTMTLSNNPDGWMVQNITIAPSRLTRNITLSVVSAYGDSKAYTNILNEIEVYGSVPQTSSTLPTSSTTPLTTPNTLTTFPSTATTPPTTSTTLTTYSNTATMSPTTAIHFPNETDSTVLLIEAATENDAEVDTDHPRTNTFFARSRMYIVAGVVGALLILVICSTVSRKGKQTNGENDMYDAML